MFFRLVHQPLPQLLVLVGEIQYDVPRPKTLPRDQMLLAVRLVTFPAIGQKVTF